MKPLSVSGQLHPAIRRDLPLIWAAYVGSCFWPLLAPLSLPFSFSLSLFLPLCKVNMWRIGLLLRTVTRPLKHSRAKPNVTRMVRVMCHVCILCFSVRGNLLTDNRALQRSDSCDNEDPTERYWSRVKFWWKPCTNCYRSGNLLTFLRSYTRSQ